MKYHKSLLISCVGNYLNSGYRKGGIVCFHNGEIIIIDRFDSTGLYNYRGVIYRFIRSLKVLISYDLNGIKSFYQLPDIKDGHDILVTPQDIICVSTGKNTINWYDHLGFLKKTWQAKGEGDAWHINSIFFHKNDLYFSAFGEFNNNNEWAIQGCRQKGFICNLRTGEKILDNLSLPHHPKFIDQDLFVCNSGNNSLIAKYHTGETIEVFFNGFTRGLAYSQDHLYIGESQDRKAKLVNESVIKIVERKTLKVINEIKIPFSEIYEIVLISHNLANKIINSKDNFQLNFDSNILSIFDREINNKTEEIKKLKQHIEVINNRSIRNKITNFFSSI